MNEAFQPLGTVEQTPPTQVPGKKIGRFAASVLITKTSWNILKQDKEMIWFPVLSVITSIIVMVLFVAAYFFLVAGGDIAYIQALGEAGTEHQAGWGELIYFFLFYVATYFVAVFFQAGIVAIAHGRLAGNDLSFSDGMAVARKHAGVLLVWSVINATVGLILQQIAERSKLLGRIVIRLVGAAWSLLTYFILPILVLEEKKMGDAIKSSGQAIKRTWGETVIVNVGVGLFFFVLTLLGVAVFVGAVFLGDGLIIFITLLLLLAYVLILGLVSSTLNTIFKVILYEYASRGSVPTGVPSEVVTYAFKQQ